MWKYYTVSARRLALLLGLLVVCGVGSATRLHAQATMKGVPCGPKCTYQKQPTIEERVAALEASRDSVRAALDEIRRRIDGILKSLEAPADLGGGKADAIADLWGNIRDLREKVCKLTKCG